MQRTRYLALGLVSASLAFAGCATDAPQERTVASKPASKPKHKRPTTVQGCMKHAKLVDTEFQGGNGASEGYRKWTGTTPDGDLVRITQLESKSAAKSAVKVATEVQGAAGGRYSVISALGTQNTINPLAHCLRLVK